MYKRATTKSAVTGALGKVGKSGAYAMKRVAAGAHLPTPTCPDDRADYCLDCSFLPWCKHQVLVFCSCTTQVRLREIEGCSKLTTYIFQNFTLPSIVIVTLETLNRNFT